MWALFFCDRRDAALLRHLSLRGVPQGHLLRGAQRRGNPFPAQRCRADGTEVIRAHPPGGDAHIAPPEKAHCPAGHMGPALQGMDVLRGGHSRPPLLSFRASDCISYERFHFAPFRNSSSACCCAQVRQDTALSVRPAAISRSAVVMALNSKRYIFLYIFSPPSMRHNCVKRAIYYTPSLLFCQYFVMEAAK